MTIISLLCISCTQENNNEEDFKDDPTQFPKTPKEQPNGDYSVDLGLSVMWATCNIGAEKPEDRGYYFAWGESSHGKTSYTMKSYLLCSTGITMFRYNSTDKKVTLEGADDAAYWNWRGYWRMPTKEEFEELLNECEWNWTSLNGTKGYKVTSKKKGFTDKSIFLPAAGYRSGSDYINNDKGGYYWTATRRTDYEQEAWNMTYLDGNRYTDMKDRYLGMSVRPVCE